ncbi:MAG TPA: hypothetical protein VD902_07035 [Symbiobacteriaceae bacterium]|nr:hypothetical protein [Symbiobacteriaceae bacterium]
MPPEGPEAFAPRQTARAPDLTSAEDVLHLRLTHMERLPDDVVWLLYAVKR